MPRPRSRPGIARRLAIAFWKGERAEKIETALFDAAPSTRQNGYRQEEADPLTTFDLKRFNAVRGYQAQQGREISRCLKELRQLRKDATRGMHGRTRGDVGKRTREPARGQRRRGLGPGSDVRNEPADPAPPEFWTVDGVPLLDAWGRPRRHPLAVARERAAGGG